MSSEELLFQRPDPMATEAVKRAAQGYHTHRDKSGLLHKCYHVCRHRWWIWGPILFFGQIMLFPLEHQAAEALWQLPVFDQVADYMGWFDEEHAE